MIVRQPASVTQPRRTAAVERTRHRTAPLSSSSRQVANRAASSSLSSSIGSAPQADESGAGQHSSVAADRANPRPWPPHKDAQVETIQRSDPTELDHCVALRTCMARRAKQSVCREICVNSTRCPSTSRIVGAVQGSKPDAGGPRWIHNGPVTVAGYSITESGMPLGWGQPRLWLERLPRSTEVHR